MFLCDFLSPATDNFQSAEEAAPGIRKRAKRTHRSFTPQITNYRIGYEASFSGDDRNK
jgi:hypothetical protein